jgi:hypothetical protein
MIFSVVSAFIFIVCIPSVAFAWGPLTHIYLGNELISLGALIPAGLLEIIRRHRKDFLYGNIMADIIVGKKYLPKHKNSHSWDVAFDLFRAAETKQQKAFVSGYMCHLAADTVAHNIYTVEKRNIGHTLLEMKADCIVDKKYWVQAMEIDRTIQLRNDMFLEQTLDRFIFSFKTNKRILKGMVFLTVFNRERLSDFIDRNLITSLPDRKEIEELQQESLQRIVDLFQSWDKSFVTKENPNGITQQGRLIKKELVTYLLETYRMRTQPLHGTKDIHTRKRRKTKT